MRFFSVKEIAEQLGVSLGTVYAAIDRGELKAHRFGRKTAIRISDENLATYLERAEVGHSTQRVKSTAQFRHLKLS